MADMKTGEASDSRTWVGFLLVFFLLAAGILSIGYSYYRNYEQLYRTEVENHLSAIAALKGGELTQYRRERLADGALLFQNAPISALVRLFLEEPAPPADAHHQLEAWLSKFQTRYQYDQVRLLDAEGVTRLSLPAGLPAVSSTVARSVANVLRSGRVTLQDFYRSQQDQKVHMGVLVPIFDEQDANRPLGVFFLRINPDTYLYPLIRDWPTPSKTAETLLVRREGNEVVALNELRFQTNTALNLRAPLDRVAMPSVQAALGREGVMEGIDYRGERVVTALRAIPGSPWFLVALMDAAEVYESLQKRLWIAFILIAALLFGAGALLWMVRQQSVRFYRKQAKMASQDRLMATVVRDSNDAITTQDFDGRITAWNRGAELMYGYSEQEALSANIARLTPPDKVAEQNDFMRRLIEGEAITSFKTQKVTKNGRILDVWMTVTKLMDDAGNPVGLTSTEHNITARKREEENLKLMATVVKASNDAIIFHDIEERITAWNHGAELMFGYSEQEALQMTIGQLSPPHKTAEQKNINRLIYAGENVSSYETQRLTKNGSILDVWMTVSKIADNEGKVIGIAATERDITTRKQDMLELKKKNAELERFLYTASHDLKTPIVTIRTFLGYLEQDMAGADAGSIEKDLGFLRTAADKMARLLDDLLEFACIGRVVNKPVRVTLENLTGEALSLVAGRIAELGIAVKVSGNGATLNGDPLRLAEIWQNLVENACKFMGNQTEPCIEIGVEERGTELVFFVRDNGIGINPRYFKKIFDLFEKFDPKAEGTGLGLALVKRIVELYQGRIWVESPGQGQGQGACFYFTLPDAVDNQKEGGAVYELRAECSAAGGR